MSPNRLPNSQSIVLIDDEYVNKEEDVQSPLKKNLSRGIIIDESTEKCVVQNIDNGKKMTLKKKRIMALNKTTHAKQAANSRNLLQIIPFFIIRAKPSEPVNDSAVKRILKNSRYYGDEIKLNIGITSLILIKSIFF